MVRIVGEISRSGRVGDRRGLVEIVQGQTYRRRRPVAVTVAGGAARRVVAVGGHQRLIVEQPRPGPGQEPAVGVVGVSHRLAVGVGLGGQETAHVVGPAGGRGHVCALPGLHRRPAALRVVGVFDRVLRAGNLLQGSRRVILVIGLHAARRGHLGLAAHRVVFKACNLAVHGLGQGLARRVVGVGNGIDRGLPIGLHDGADAVEFVVRVSGR
ncbi:hypothetical protein SDC9_145388 [bioreactor metagenome]|uniref:Uncharacterized protein n=1 Tax=bioreactor metagenome TaxID=1076179 RepID=A0A645E8A2_9ZZZZ